MSWPATVGVLVGNPKPRSRTFTAALGVQDAVVGLLCSAGQPAVAGQVVDAAELAPQVFAPEGAGRIGNVLESLALLDVLIVASPTYKASYTGLLKAVLDHSRRGLLDSVVGVPVMVGASSRHALAVELHLRPLLVELGATVPGRGLALRESEVDSGTFGAAVADWVSASAAGLLGLLGSGARQGGAGAGARAAG